MNKTNTLAIIGCRTLKNQNEAIRKNSNNSKKSSQKNGVILLHKTHKSICEPL